MLGQAAVTMWWDIPPAMKAEFEDWHTHEHMPERLAIPGFLRGTRWITESGEPSYFICYEVANLATITGYKGIDPEIPRNDIRMQGIDNRDKFPTVRTYTIGVNVNF